MIKQKVNLIVVFSPDHTNVLMCRRRKPPYLGKLNFVGGKIEPGERQLHAAYRELYEETGIPKEKIRLTRILTFDYPTQPSYNFLSVYTGCLSESIPLNEELNPLIWVDVATDFSDLHRFAGDGNIVTIINTAKDFIMKR